MCPHCSSFPFPVLPLWRTFSIDFHVKIFFYHPCGAVVKNLPASAGDTRDMGWSLGWEDLLEEEMATHSRILAWEISRTMEPGRLLSMGSPKVGHYWEHTHTHTHTHDDYLEEELSNLGNSRDLIQVFSFLRL